MCGFYIWFDHCWNKSILWLCSHDLLVITVRCLVSGCVLCFYVVSCRGRCGEAFSRGQVCTCDDDCLTHSECCKDYEDVCTSRKADLVLFSLINTVLHDSLHESTLYWTFKAIMWARIQFRSSTESLSSWGLKLLVRGPVGALSDSPESCDEVKDKLACCCFLDGSCRGRCWEAFRRGRECECDPDCTLYNSCCPDYSTHCGMACCSPQINSLDFIAIYYLNHFIFISVILRINNTGGDKPKKASLCLRVLLLSIFY